MKLDTGGRASYVENRIADGSAWYIVDSVTEPAFCPVSLSLGNRSQLSTGWLHCRTPPGGTAEYCGSRGISHRPFP